MRNLREFEDHLLFFNFRKDLVPLQKRIVVLTHKPVK